MALVESSAVTLGAKMPSFELENAQGTLFRSHRLTGQVGTLVVFTCNHCPYAIATWPRLIHLAQAFRDQGIVTIAINPNIHPDYPADSPEEMLRKVAEWGIPFPYLVDRDQSVARAFAAQCTPDPYLYDGTGSLVYHGRIDDSWKDESAVTRTDLRDAMAALVDGSPVPADQVPSMGCSIKWVY